MPNKFINGKKWFYIPNHMHAIIIGFVLCLWYICSCPTKYDWYILLWTLCLKVNINWKSPLLQARDWLGHFHDLLSFILPCFIQDNFKRKRHLVSIIIKSCFLIFILVIYIISIKWKLSWILDWKRKPFYNCWYFTHTSSKGFIFLFGFFSMKHW